MGKARERDDGWPEKQSRVILLREIYGTVWSCLDLQRNRGSGRSDRAAPGAGTCPTNLLEVQVVPPTRLQ